MYSFFSLKDKVSNLFHVLKRDPVRETEWKQCSLRAVENIVDCLRTWEKPHCTIDMAVKNLETYHRIVESIKN